MPGDPQAARSTFTNSDHNSASSAGSLWVGISDSKDTHANSNGSLLVGIGHDRSKPVMSTSASASSQSVRSIYVSASDFLVSDLNGYDAQDYVWAYDVAGHGYNARATKVVDLILAIRILPANKNKYPKRSGSKSHKEARTT